MSPRWGSTPRLTDWLTVSRNVTLTWLVRNEECRYKLLPTKEIEKFLIRYTSSFVRSLKSLSTLLAGCSRSLPLLQQQRKDYSHIQKHDLCASAKNEHQGHWGTLIKISRTDYALVFVLLMVLQQQIIRVPAIVLSNFLGWGETVHLVCQPLCMYVCMYVCVRGGPNQPLHRDPQWSIVLPLLWLSP
jgi:hypothetical protein